MNANMKYGDGGYTTFFVWLMYQAYKQTSEHIQRKRRGVY